jgi:hypothetical protein
MHKQNALNGDEVTASPLQFASDLGGKALDLAQDQVVRAATGTGKAVRKYPMAAAGIALGAGVAIGALGYRLLAPKRPKTLFERLASASLLVTAARGINKLF